MKKTNPLILIFGDVLAYIYSIIPGILAWSLGFYIIYTCSFSILSIIIFPIIVMISFIFVCFILQRILPKLKPGLYRPGLDKQVIIWHLNNQLANALENACLKTPIYSFHLTRWLYWRAMGMKVPFGIICSTLVTIREYSLITIEKGVSFSAYNHISCHSYEGERLIIGAISIGQNSFIGMRTIVGPKTKIGKNCFIGGDNVLIFDNIKDDTRIESFEFEYCSPRKKLYPPHAKEGFKVYE